MIIKTEVINGIKTYHVDKNFDDDTMDSKLNTFVDKKDIKDVIDESVDIYTVDGKLLLRFRKNALSANHVDGFYNNIIKFARTPTSNRGSATGSNSKNVYDNPRIMTNIFGYFDKWSPKQKSTFRKLGKKPEVDVRECRFNMDEPEKYKKTLPLIKEIDRMYSKLVPEQYRKQKKKARSTHFKIDKTAFTTVTTNVNFRTTIHTDKGDDEDGFGNLVVIENGDYSGAETCFPQYGIGVNVRNGDMLFMDVHQPHGNLEMKKNRPDSERLSIVCYLRKNIWLKTKNKTKKFYENHNKTVRSLRHAN
jgi:hypothetical protein